MSPGPSPSVPWTPPFSRFSIRVSDPFRSRPPASATDAGSSPVRGSGRPHRTTPPERARTGPAPGCRGIGGSCVEGREGHSASLRTGPGIRPGKPRLTIVVKSLKNNEKGWFLEGEERGLGRPLFRHSFRASCPPSAGRADPGRRSRLEPSSGTRFAVRNLDHPGYEGPVGLRPRLRSPPSLSTPAPSARF